MPPKSAKDKKLERQREAEAHMQKKKVLDAAVALDNHLAALLPFTTFKRHGLDLTIAFSKHADAAKDDVQACFELLKKNMQQQSVGRGAHCRRVDEMRRLSLSSVGWLLSSVVRRRQLH